MLRRCHRELQFPHQRTLEGLSYLKRTGSSNWQLAAVEQLVLYKVQVHCGRRKGHAPFMTTLNEGDVVVIDGGQRRTFRIHGGFADVTPEGLTILAEHATEALA